MFGKDKGPTKQLDALLRAVAKHVVSNYFPAPDSPKMHRRVDLFLPAVQS